MPGNTQHYRQTGIHAPGGFRTCNPRKRAAVDPSLRPCGHRDRPHVVCYLSLLCASIFSLLCASTFSLLCASTFSRKEFGADGVCKSVQNARHEKYENYVIICIDI